LALVGGGFVKLADTRLPPNLHLQEFNVLPHKSARSQWGEEDEGALFVLLPLRDFHTACNVFEFSVVVCITKTLLA
jgi:hypothetical protein